MELYGFMEREKKIPSYFFIITKGSFKVTEEHPRNGNLTI